MSKKIYKEPSKEFAKKFEKLVKDSGKIVITSHMSPDDDAIACVLSMYVYLTEFLKRENVQVVFEGEVGDRWEYFKDYKNIKSVENINDVLNDVDLLILLDGSDWYRFSKDEEMSKFSGSTVCIDHHPGPKDIHNLHLLVENSPSCVQILYELFFKGKTTEPRASEIILLGIMGDTGGLRFIKPDDAEVLLIVKNLIELGNIDLQTFASRYKKLGYEQFKIITILMNNTGVKKIGKWPTLMYSYLKKDIVEKYDPKIIGEAYHVYVDQYMRMVEGTDWGFVAIPKGDNTYGFSFRSLPGSVNVRLLASSLGGGGHNRAAGMKLEASNHKDAVDIVFNWMKKNTPVID